MHFGTETHQAIKAIKGSISAGLLLNLILRLNKRFQTTESKREKILVVAKLLALNVTYIILLRRL